MRGRSPVSVGFPCKLCGFGLGDESLISVRSVVDMRLACGQSSIVSGRFRGLRLESTQAHYVEVFALLGLIRPGGVSLCSSD